MLLLTRAARRWDAAEMAGVVAAVLARAVPLALSLCCGRVAVLLLPLLLLLSPACCSLCFVPL